MDFTPEFLLQLVHHAALPRDVPGNEEQNLSAIGTGLLERVIEAVKTVGCEAREYFPLVDSIRLTLEISKKLNVEGMVNKHLLVEAINELDGNHAFFLHVTEQNAALLLYNNTGYVSNLLSHFEVSASLPSRQSIRTS